MNPGRSGYDKFCLLFAGLATPHPPIPTPWVPSGLALSSADPLEPLIMQLEACVKQSEGRPERIKVAR